MPSFAAPFPHHLIKELRRIRNIKVTIIPMIVDEIGAVPRRLESRLDELLKKH